MTGAKQKIISFLVVFSFVFLLFSQNSAMAGDLLKTQEGFSDNGSDSVARVFNGGNTAPQDIRVTMAKIIRTFLGFLGIIFLALVLYAGFLWMTAGGNEEKIQQSIKYLSRSVIGLIIILASYSITGLALCKIVDATGESVFSCMF